MLLLCQSWHDTVHDRRVLAGIDTMGDDYYIIRLSWQYTGSTSHSSISRSAVRAIDVLPQLETMIANLDD